MSTGRLFGRLLYWFVAICLFSVSELVFDRSLTNREHVTLFSGESALQIQFGAKLLQNILATEGAAMPDMKFGG